MKRPLLAIGTMVGLGIAAAHAQSPAVPVPVTVDNFIRAETDLYMSRTVKQVGLGKLLHIRNPVAIDQQMIIRMNRDTLYSNVVFDLDAGPATITMPDAGKRFMSMQLIDQDHYVPAVYYGPGAHTLTAEGVGTRYVSVAIRTLVDPTDPKDLEHVHALQDAINVEQKSPGKFEIPDWDPVSQKEVRDALLLLAAHTGGFKNAFGARGKVDPIRHLIGTAAGWGGNPDGDASYLSYGPPKNDGNTVYKLSVPGDVPVDAFWSISVYNKAGYFQKNDFDAYSLNDITAKKSADGSVVVQFGGCDGKIPNCLPITPGWNYVVRMYRPRAEILSGKWKFPEANAVN
jgi:hypothetical protein